MKTYTTTEVAAAARTTSRAVRLWEKAGLFDDVARDRQGERRFSESQMQRAKVISAASMAGWPLADIRTAHDATLVSVIGAATRFMKSVYESMNKDFDL